MILDTSAILAILFDEPERETFIQQIGAQPVVGVGAPTLAEASIVLASRVGDAAGRHMADFVERAALVVIPFEAAHWRAAVDAWLRFGRGRHQAALNLGDCLSYATARVAGRPLLCSPRATSSVGRTCRWREMGQATKPLPGRCQLARRCYSGRLPGMVWSVRSRAHRPLA